MTKSAVQDHKPTRSAALTRAVFLDRAEQAAIVILYSLLVYRVSLSENPFAVLLAVTEGAILFFVLVRRPTAAISLRLGDWLLAFTATAAPLLIAPGNEGPEILIPAGVMFVLFGNGLQLWAKFVLRRSFGIAPANRGVKVGGPYRAVRHPMYAGYLASHIGLFMLMPSLFNLAVYTIAWCAQVLRLQAEERLLSDDAAYQALKDRVRYRLIPGIY
jgi:protein-S-isoprenylcysteine O-methyltransferase Ste14